MCWSRAGLASQELLETRVLPGWEEKFGFESSQRVHAPPQLSAEI